MDVYDEYPEFEGTIYGNSGIHRYFVRANGDVLFSESHAASKNSLALANKAGFMGDDQYRAVQDLMKKLKDKSLGDS
ncbi:MAG: hypothetical protein INF44_01910 [Thalassospira sp.]|nr:hypothetical protein [Thalassospira sp.]